MGPGAAPGSRTPPASSTAARAGCPDRTAARRGPLGHMKFRLSELTRWADQHTTRAKRAS